MLDDYLERLALELKKYKISEIPAEPIQNVVLDKIESMSVYMLDIIDIYRSVLRFSPEKEYIDLFARFIERLIEKTLPIGLSTYNRAQFDHFYFFGYEVILYMAALSLKFEKFEQLNYILDKDYFCQNFNAAHGSIVSYSYFSSDIISFALLKQSTSSNRVSLLADKVKERLKTEYLSHQDLLQADLALFIRNNIMMNEGRSTMYWFPINLVYVPFHSNECIFEFFLKMSRKSFFERAKVALGIYSEENILEKLGQQFVEPLHFSSHSFNQVSAQKLSNFESWPIHNK